MARQPWVWIVRRCTKVRSVMAHSLPDDRLFIALLTTWVGLLAVATYLLLGWASAGLLVVILGVMGIGTIAFQTRHPHRQDHQRIRTSAARNR
jgi:uncharacterized membrane protein YccC